MHVPYIDLGLQYRTLEGPIDSAIKEVLSSGSYILGKQLEAFEKEFAQYHGVAEAVGVASGTDALELALRAIGVKAGDEVVVPAFTFVATAEAVLHLGAKPVFVDVEPDTLTLDPDRFEAAITNKTRAVIPVHLYGQPCDMERIVGVAKAKGIWVIEDCAQGIGASLDGKKVGTWGEVGCFSFFPTKNLGGCGDGGMVITSNGELAHRLRRLRNHGASEKYRHIELGRNSRLDELQAAILRIKLSHIDRWNAARRSVADGYRKAFQEAAQECPIPVRLPVARADRVHTYHIFAIRVPQRDALKAFLNDQGVEALVHYPRALHRQDLFVSLLPELNGLSLRESERAAEEVLSLPIYPEMKPEAVTYVVEQVVRFYRLERCQSAPRRMQ
jgi:dTDP-4-amino-4,6-dideoxygalactose transaminase